MPEAESYDTWITRHLGDGKYQVKIVPVSRAEALARHLAGDDANVEVFIGQPIQFETPMGRAFAYQGKAIPLWRAYLNQATEILAFIDAEEKRDASPKG